MLAFLGRSLRAAMGLGLGLPPVVLLAERLKVRRGQIGPAFGAVEDVIDVSGRPIAAWGLAVRFPLELLGAGEDPSR